MSDPITPEEFQESEASTVRDQFAPASWPLADAGGNEADISTAMGRE